MHICPSWVVQKWHKLACWHQYLGHSSFHKNPKVKVIDAIYQDTRPKVHAHAHPPFMVNPQAHIGHDAINTLDIAVSTGIPWPRSWNHGQRWQDQNSMPMYIYPCWVVRGHILAMLVLISWTQQVQQAVTQLRTHQVAENACFWVWLSISNCWK